MHFSTFGPGKLHHYRFISLIVHEILIVPLLLYTFQVLRFASLSSYIPITMVPCECGAPFDDLTHWKAHSIATGHCCIYKCRKPASASRSPGFLFEGIKTPTMPMNHHHESWNAHPAFQFSPCENGHSPSYYNGRSPVSSHPVHGRYELPHAREPAAPRLQHPPKGHPPLHDTWQDPVPPVSQPAQGHHPLSHLCCEVQPSSVSLPVMASFIKSAITATPEMPTKIHSKPVSPASPAPKGSKLFSAATPAASKSAKTPHVTVKSTSKRKPYPCSHCKRAFRTEESLGQHFEDSHFEFPSKPCSHCKRAFRTEQGLRQHFEALHSGLPRKVSGPICDTCKESFPGQDSLEQHQRTVHTSQFRCCDCEKDFISEQALDQHLNDKSHPKIPCQICEQDFASILTLNRHVVAEHHASVDPKRNLYRAGVHGCFICQRKFGQKSDLDRHLTSLKHHPLSDLPCIASDKCKRRFVSPSALLHHLESGTCRSGIDRHAINNLVRDNDVECIISSGPVGQSLLEFNENPSESSSSSGTPVFTPTSSVSSSPVPDTMMENTMLQHVPFLSLGAENPSFATMGGASIPSTFEILTPSSSRKSFNFDTVGRFPSFHANRSSHKLTPTLFHCPTALVDSTPHSERPKTFSTLSGLAQHIESGACGEGLATLKKAMDFVQEHLDKIGLGSIRLLK